MMFTSGRKLTAASCFELESENMFPATFKGTEKSIHNTVNQLARFVSMNSLQSGQNNKVLFILRVRNLLKQKAGFRSVLTSGGKSTENLYSSTSTVTLLKYYSITSKSTGV